MEKWFRIWFRPFVHFVIYFGHQLADERSHHVDVWCCLCIACNSTKGDRPRENKTFWLYFYCRFRSHSTEGIEVETKFDIRNYEGETEIKWKWKKKKLGKKTKFITPSIGAIVAVINLFLFWCVFFNYYFFFEFENVQRLLFQLVQSALHERATSIIPSMHARLGVQPTHAILAVRLHYCLVLRLCAMQHSHGATESVSFHHESVMNIIWRATSIYRSF